MRRPVCDISSALGVAGEGRMQVSLKEAKLTVHQSSLRGGETETADTIQWNILSFA